MSSARRPARAGQPLLLIVAILGGWLAARVALFELPPMAMGNAAATLENKAAETIALASDGFAARRNEPSGQGASAGPNPLATSAWPGAARIEPAPPASAALQPGRPDMAAVPPYAGPAGTLPQPLPLARPERPAPAPIKPASTAAGHNLLWMAAMSAIPLSPEVAALFGSPVAGPSPKPAMAAQRASRSLAGARPPAMPRWSGDGWILLRGGAFAQGSGIAGAPGYGGSQAGAVLRYALAPQSSLRPAAYVRTVAALAQPRDIDVAAGIQLRPIAGVPVTVHGELRASRRGDGVELRPAAFASAGFELAEETSRIGGRGYLQAGYVGGHGGTAFVDGSAIAETALSRGAQGELAAGGGVWGGAQRGAGRLDVGPSASLRFRLGDGGGRVAVDYRLRVAGNAEPRAGAALTLSAGF